MQKRLSLLLFIIICVFPFSSLAVVYVDIDNTGTENGTSWDYAYNTIQEGINAATSGEEVWVAEGTYYIYSSSTDDTVMMANGVHLYGGFAGTETAKSQRNWEIYVTTIDGRQSQGSANQVKHVVTFFENSTVTGYSATIDGFTITGGNSAQMGPQKRIKQPRATSPDAIFTSQGNGCAGGILIWRCNPRVENCIITNNSASKGGGVYAMVATTFPSQAPNPAPSFINCTFSNNTASARGGGISNDVATHPTFTNCVFMNNSCDAKGGAMYNDFGCSPTLINCLIAQNTAEQASAMGIDGSSSPKLVNCTVTDNYAYDIGAGLYTGSYLGTPNEPVLVNCIVWGNENQWGGPVDMAIWHENHFYTSYSLLGTGFTARDEGDGDGDGVLQGETIDPLFVNPGAGDYSLQSTSPCINSGTNSDTDVQSTDIDGKTRVDLPDMGAYEYTGIVSTGTLTVAIEPSEAVSAGARWSVDGSTWYDGGTTQTLTEGDYTVTYKTVSGYDAPASDSVTVLSSTPVSITGIYTEQVIEQTTGLFINDPAAYEGYTLFAPMQSKNTYLIDNEGTVIHTWTSSYNPGLSVYLLENGNLLRTGNTNNATFNAGGAGGIVEELDLDGNVVWSYTLSGPEACLHHDVEYLPNGNILMIAWEMKTESEAVAAGRNPNLLSDGELWPDTIIEVDPFTNTIVWEWRVWDHLVQDYDSNKPDYGVVSDNPQLIDLNYTFGPTAGADWTHFNSVEYIEEFDQIMVSVHSFSEIWVIDHSTTTAEAAGHSGGNSGKGGDLLYRWGNPQTYGQGDSTDQKLYSQHHATWIPAGYPGEGDILIFNNGTMRPGDDYSTIEQITPPIDEFGSYTYSPGFAYGPASSTWTYTAANPTGFYSKNISGAQRLANGNTLICEGTTGRFFETAQDGTIVWEYVNPVTDSGVLGPYDTIPTSPMGDQKNQVFNVNRYYPAYPGLSGIVPVNYTLDNAIATLQILCGIDTTLEWKEAVPDGKANLSDVVYILWYLAGLQ